MNDKIATRLLFRIGELVEQGIDIGMERTGGDARDYDGKNIPGQWYRLPVQDGICGDGSAYHIYINYGSCDSLCVFFSGGGMVWDANSAANPVTASRVAAGLPNYYWNNLRPMSELMNIHSGIMDKKRRDNPFREWNFAVITYATGDFHSGDGELVYVSDALEKAVHRFHGLRNFRAAMKEIISHFDSTERLLIAGDSAGGFAVPALAQDIMTQYYPGCTDVTLLSDSSILISDKWRDILKDIWKTETKLWEASVSGNLLVDWYSRLTSLDPGKKIIRYLYAGSTHDYLLSAYQNEFMGGEFKTTESAMKYFNQKLTETMDLLGRLEPGFDFYIYDWKNPLYTRGGTIHTAIRLPAFYFKNSSGRTMAEWLYSHVSGS